MAARIERTIAGEFAYLTDRRDGPVLWWGGPGTTVKFAFNRVGTPWEAVEEPRRFGGTPQTSKQFREFVQRFQASLGHERRRGPGLLRPRSRVNRRVGR